MDKKDAGLDTPDTAGFAEDVQELESETGFSPEDMVSDPEMDFSLSDEYKPPSLIPKGRYEGNVVGVTYSKVKRAIIWKVTMEGNPGVCSDGETPVDGIQLVYNNWLPKPGDDREFTKDGRMTKRQVKINMMKDFADAMKINMDSPAIIAEQIAEATWVGLRVVCEVGISEYQGRVRNDINSMITAE